MKRAIAGSLGLTLFLASSFGFAPSALATRLVFEPASGAFGDFSLLPSGYGNRVAATTQDGFLYALDGGVTPNVSVYHGASAGLPSVYAWSGNFGDLQHVLFAQEPELFEMRFNADPGFTVVLDSLDMAGWPNLTFPSIATVAVLNAAGDTLFARHLVNVFGSAGGPGHTHIDLGSPRASGLVLIYDSRSDGLGNVLDSDDVGIDNITFHQSGTTAVDPLGPAGVRLALTGANPTFASARLSYSLAGSRDVLLAVYDLHGRLVRTLARGTQAPGPHEAEWNGCDEQGASAGPGVYFARLLQGSDVATCRIALLR